MYPIQNISRNEEREQPVKRAAAYCRVSSGSEEQLNSFNAQVQYYKKYICDNPDYEFAGIYADEGISGTDLRKRDGFNQMIKDAKAGKIDVIITKSISRFGRNTVDTLNAVRELKELNIDIYFDKENIHTINSEGELLITLLSATAQQTSQSQSENLKWGIHKQYERGNIKSVGSGKFLGYTKDEEGNLIIDEKEALIVRRIYKEFLEGNGTHQIAKRLTEEKVPMTFGGKGWCPSHIKRVLTNEKHKGDFRFQKTYIVSYLTQKRAKNNGELPQYYSEDSHPAIIDKKTWELAQLEFERQKDYCLAHRIKGRYHNDQDRFPFSGRVTCGVCGNTYMQMIDDDGNKYYRCKSFKGNRETIIEGREYTPPPMATWSKNPNPKRKRKKPVPRQMYCTDIKMPIENIEKAFIDAWNLLVENTDWIEDIGEPLQSYRSMELKKLLSETGKVDVVDSEIIKRTLEHIEVSKDARIEVSFLSGTKINIEKR